MSEGEQQLDPPLTRQERRLAQRRNRLRRRLKIAGITTGVTILVLAGSVFGYAEYLNHEIQRVGVRHLQATASSGSEKDVENILLVGSTDRCVLKQQSQAFGICSEGVTGVNSDVVMILHLDPDHHRAAILSIPRDLFVPNARTTGAYKIDAALFQGPSQLVDAIEQDFGIPIQHYAELNFDSFQGVVEALGGVKMYFPMPLYDAYSSLDIPTAGCRQLSGFQALAVVRARHLQYKPPDVTTNAHAYWPQDPQSDLSRIRRDHEFIRVLAAAVGARGLGNPITDQQLVAAVAPQLQVDSGLGLTDMVNLVLTFHTVNPATAPQQTLPVRLHGGTDFFYEGYDYGSVEFPSQPEDHQAVDSFLGLPSNVDTMTGAPLPDPGSVTVSVVSGTGVGRDATTVASRLEADGFDVVNTGYAAPRSYPAETLVTYSSSSAAGRAAAEEVARALTGPVVLDATTDTQGPDVVLTVGSGLAVGPLSSGAAPATTTTTTTTTFPGTRGTSPSSTTTTTAVSGGGSTLEPVTPPTETLAPFDPRSCTRTGGEGP
ncbi:MAG: LCP family protein [Acidimicrobiales bacterium]